MFLRVRGTEWDKSTSFPVKFALSLQDIITELGGTPNVSDSETEGVKVVPSKQEDKEE